MATLVTGSISGTASVTSNNTGSGGFAAPFPSIQPSKTVNFIIKVTPDIKYEDTDDVYHKGVCIIGNH